MIIRHLVVDDKFIDTAFDAFEKANPSKNEYVLLSFRKELKYIKRTPVKVVNPFVYIFKSLFERKDHFVTIIHWMDYKKILYLILNFQFERILWIGWGGDYYPLIMEKKSLLLPKTSQHVERLLFSIDTVKEFFFGLLKRFGLRKISYFSPVLKSDYDLLKKELKDLPAYIPWNYGNLEDYLTIGLKSQTTTQKHNILIGNSSALENNHLDAFELLYGVELGDRKIICPLSYGDIKNKELIRIEGKKSFGDAFVSLDTFMPLNEYNAIISSCSIVIMNHLRQQGLGNILTMLYAGAKIFLNEKNPIYLALTDLGANIYSTSDILSKREQIFTGLKPEEIERNREVLKRFIGKHVMEEKTKSLISMLIPHKIKSRNLVFFTRSFPYGKEETFIETEINYLSENFEKITIIPLEKRPHLRPVPSNVDVLPPMYSGKKKMEVFLKSWTIFFHPRLLGCFLGSFLNLKSMKQLVIVSWMRTYLRKNNLLKDNISQWYFYWGVNQASYLCFYYVPNFKAVRFHRYDLYESQNERIPFRRTLLRNTDKAICISNHGNDVLNSWYPEFSSKIETYKLGTNEFGINPEKREEGHYVLLSCSNMIPLKRVHLIAEALVNISLPIKWVHFGDGPEESRIKKIISRFPKHVTAHLPGRVPNREVLSFFQNEHIDLFLNVSSSEGIPVSIMEAISFGVPVLATNVDGNGEIVNNDLGQLVPPDLTAADLRERLETLLPNLNNQIRVNARKKWESDFSASKNYKNFCDFLIDSKS